MCSIVRRFRGRGKVAVEAALLCLVFQNSNAVWLHSIIQSDLAVLAVCQSPDPDHLYVLYKDACEISMLPYLRVLSHREKAPSTGTNTAATACCFRHTYLAVLLEIDALVNHGSTRERGGMSRWSAATSAQHYKRNLDKTTRTVMSDDGSKVGRFFFFIEVCVIRVVQTSISLVDFAVDFDFDLGLRARAKSVSNFDIPRFRRDFARFRSISTTGSNLPVVGV